MISKELEGNLMPICGGIVVPISDHLEDRLHEACWKCLKQSSGNNLLPLVEFCKDNTKPLNPQSRKHLIQELKRVGWLNRKGFLSKISSDETLPPPWKRLPDAFFEVLSTF